MSTEIRDIINLLEDEEEPITKPQVEKVLKNDGYEHLKVSGNKITVLTQLPDGSKSGEFRKATIDEILQTLSREVPEHEPSFSSATNLSSIGGILFKNSKVHIVVKDIGKQGDKSAGIANEVEIAGMIESVIQKYGSADITFTDDRGVELEIKNADNVIVAGRDTGNRKKADILIKLIKDGKLELIELKDKTTAKGEPVYKLSKEIVIEPTAEEAMNAIFGSDINPAGGVIIQTFKPEHYTQDEDKIDVEAHIVIKEIDDIPQSHLMVWLLRNDSTRNIASIGYAGIRPLGVTLERGFGKSGNKDVITVNKDGNVVSAKDIIALDKEIDRIQQVDIDKRELRDKAKEITKGGSKNVDDIFAKKMDKEGVGRKKR